MVFGAASKVLQPGMSGHAGCGSRSKLPSPVRLTVMVSGSLTAPLALFVRPEIENRPTAPEKSAGAPGGSGRTSRSTGIVLSLLAGSVRPPGIVIIAGPIVLGPAMVGKSTLFISSISYLRPATILEDRLGFESSRAQKPVRSGFS